MDPKEPIVIVGSACRFPGKADSPSKLWELLQEPKDLQSEVPKERFNIDAFYHPDGSHPGRTNARHGYFLQNNLRAFDAPFFNIQPVEAETMDPQQRLLLETTYEALNSAGLRLQDLRGSDTAVYVGLMTHDFEVTKYHDLQNTGTYLVTGAATSIISNRLSYFFDWHGPSMTIDTACSSSLVAVHEAVQQLRSGASTVAVAAGANLILSPVSYISESKLSMLSPTGRSRMWDAAADGYARGEGICSVVLKTLSQALRDGDNIECVIRETGVNQDGRTTGITLPSHSAQEALIRETYAKAGLDLSKPQDRCQFFEAHGTGTPAGDPQEAEAIATAFFGGGNGDRTELPPLLVGSVKTVIGHTEGTAGLAGLMKASLAVQHGIIPPNLLFDQLSPRVAPFYQNLRIAREAQAWPATQSKSRTATLIRLTGFGGTNAHVIIEEYKGSSTQQAPSKPKQISSTRGLPLVLSAKSEASLRKYMERILELINTSPELDILDLAWTLLRKQSALSRRYSVAGHTKESISATLTAALKESKIEANPGSKSSSGDNISLLGIFTGQGAQWPGMMKGLMSTIPYVEDIVAELDNSLQTLPAEYRPSWMLREQFLLDETESNVAKASFSQPLCCATQIVLIRLLAAAGIKFTTIVGHSSGEIACAVAAGLVSPAQAIRIAYLRGVTSQYAASPRGEAGLMLAAGVSFEDAQELCELDAFEGRVCVAASNSPDSTTISGDEDAITQVQDILEDESKFARLLKVDKAYHSHHMLPCAEPYIKALKECGCAVADGDESSSVAWYSSVHLNTRMKLSNVTAEYWKDNLVSPVLFMQALEEAAIEHRPLDAAIEVGCHPALKAPALSTLKGIGLDDLPYTGCMQRGGDDVAAFAGALGYLWERFADLEPVNVDQFVATVSPEKPENLSKTLPRYPWDHSRVYWSESRAINSFLHGPRPHLLLGSLSAASTATVLQWQNIFRVKDHEWMKGHGLQGQALFPAAGFVVMAMEAGIHVAGDRPIKLVEVLDLSIDKAIIFEDETSPAEVNLTAKIVSRPSDTEQVVLSFSIDSCLNKETKLSTSAQGQVVVTFGSASSNSLPPVQGEHPHMIDLDINYFYRELDSLGYCYDKLYRCISNMRRADSRSAGTLPNLRLDDGGLPLVLHPATLDLSFQTIMGAYSHPGDKRLRSLYVPVHVDRIAIVPGLCAAALENSGELHFNTANTYDKGDFFAGCVEAFSTCNNHAALFHVENLVLKSLSPPTASEDHRAFTTTVWGPFMPETLLDDPALWATEEDKRVMPIIERIIYFYIKNFLRDLTAEDRQNATAPQQSYIHWYDNVMVDVAAGRHRWYEKSWEDDTAEDIQLLCEANWYHPHVRLAHRVNENAISTIRENSNPFSWMNEDGLLTEFYTSRLSTGPGWGYGKKIVDQIAHRFQSMDILEIGGGTAGATRSILSIPQLGFNSYTFTDISPAFFEKAREEFAVHQDRMEFRKLDISRSPEEQGFKPQSYDLVLASSVLHATPNLTETMANVRYLLRPGGHAVILEATHKDHTRVGYLFGLFPDWWAGRDEGRVLDPFATIDEWDAIFKRTGFSGVECRTLDRDGHIFPNSLFTTRAVTPKVTRLYQPLAAPVLESYAPLVVVGGSSSKASHVVEEISKILSHREPSFVKNLTDLRDATYENHPTFLILSEFDEELFLDINEAKLESVKSLFSQAGNVLWVTEGAWVSNPRQAMTIGMLRTIRNEYPEINVQALDVDDVQCVKPMVLIEQLLRLEEWSGAKEDVLWTYEPEVYVSKGTLLVPRIKHDMPRNDRMASGRRKIFAQASPEKAALTLQLPDKDLYLESTRANGFEGQRGTKSLAIITRFALAKAIRIGNLGYLHLLHGTVKGTDRKVIALSQSNSSIVNVPSTLVSDLPAGSELAPSVLLNIAASLLAQTIVSSIAPGASALIFEPPTFFINAIATAAAKQRIRVHFLSTQPPPVSSESTKVAWTRLHPQETDEGLKEILPTKASALYDLSQGNSVTSLSTRLARHVPASCSQIRLGHFFQDNASSVDQQEDFSPEQVGFAAQAVATAVESLINAGQVDATARPISQVSSPQDDFDVSTVLDWAAEDPVPARIRPIDHGKLFVPDKTYLLVGLAGSTGRALARWMVTRGARYIVLSSRNPQAPDPKWLKKIERLGGNITVLPMDVSKKESVDAGLAQIRQKLPPINGIAYGPLVLHDTLFRNMDISMMHPVLNAKVVGAQLLHDYFSDPTTNPLDFFIMCSSAATTGGNPGQANYNAANAFLQALAQKRRTMGLAASTIHIGAVMGVGYLATREEKFDLQSVSDMDPLGEAEFCTLVAEAVVSGRPPSPPPADGQDLTAMSEIDIGTGIPELHARFKDSLVFYSDPRFGNLKVPEKRDKTSSGLKTSIKEQLLTATGLEEVRQIIIDGMCEKLRGTLHLPADEGVDPAAPLIDQGVDSLGAITVASWFSNELVLDVPILKVLGGASVAELAEEAAGRLPSGAIPLVARDPDAVSDESDTSASASQSDYGAQTPISTPTTEVDDADRDPDVLRKAPLSLTQEYSWSLQQQLAHDPTIFHNTVGLVMEGNLDLERLSRAVATAFSRHEIFRTAIRSDSENAEQAAQVVLKAPTRGLQCIEVPDRAAAEEKLKQLETEKYELAAAEAYKIVDLYWAPDRHMLVIAYHRLTGDGSTTDNLFVELTQLYNGTQLPAPPQYADFAVKQRSDLKNGRMDADITYWKSIYATMPAVMPILALPQAQQQRATALSWQQHTSSARLSSVIAMRIKESARQLKATPMQFYLAAYKTLLALLSGQRDIVIGIADTNRSSIDDISTMGFFANMLPIRMEHEPNDKFAEVLAETKDRMRQAMLHSAVPYSVTLQRLGLLGQQNSPSAREMTHAPLFQAVFDYRQGERADSGKIGDASIVKVMVSRERTPHDVSLEMADDPSRDPLLTVKLQSSLYGPQDPQTFLKLYESVLATLSVSTTMRVGDIKVGV
nr:polyketide synthase [Colletotrichum truncatum]KAF6785623.1 polyketide synthase [Colletotrichum truncatum]